MENDSKQEKQIHVLNLDEISVKQEVIDEGYNVADSDSKNTCEREKNQINCSDSFVVKDNGQFLESELIFGAKPKVETDIVHVAKNEEFEKERREIANLTNEAAKENEIKKEVDYSISDFDNTNSLSINNRCLKFERVVEEKVENETDLRKEVDNANLQSSSGNVKVELVNDHESNGTVKDEIVESTEGKEKDEELIEGDDDGNLHGSMEVEENGSTENEDQAHFEKKGYVCHVCKKTFMKKSSLSTHVMTHTGETPFKCQFCNKGFNVRSNLNVHLRIHTGQRPHVCEICQKTFTQAGQLKTHERIHKGEKPYMCNMCTHSFRSSSALITHQRTHTGERPFPCDICSRSFSTSTSLKTHRITHSGTMLYDCPVCGRQFNRKNNLNVHIKRHNKNRKFSCPKCSNGFVMRAHLLGHLKRAHKIDLQADQLKCAEFIDGTEELSSEIEIGEEANNIGKETKYSQDIDMKSEDTNDRTDIHCDKGEYSVTRIKDEVQQLM